MMMTDRSCPDQEVLESLLLGQLEAEVACDLEEHLASCDGCAARADGIGDRDELIAAMQAKQLPPEDDGRISALIESLRDLSAETETSRLNDTHARAIDDSGRKLPDLSELLDPPAEAGEIGRIGQYRVLDFLGAGAMGLVLRAEDTDLRRPVALKLMKDEGTVEESAKSRFLREAQAIAAIEHDHIVTIYQVAEHRGMPYYAMQFLRGESLQSRLHREGKLDQREVLRIGREIAAGLAAAHARGLLHRDIKPDNIWLEEDTGRVKIVDFGLVRSTEDDHNITLSGMVVGTPRYMSPEQARGEAVDHRCDLFSLGSVLYHLVTGQPPFARANLPATLTAIVNDRPRPANELRPEVDGDLVRLIDRLLAKEPGSRFQSAAEVVDTISQIEQRLAEQTRGGTEAEAKPHTGVGLPRQNPTRRRTATIAFVALALLAIVLAAVVFRTPQGDVRIEVNDENLEVLIDEARIALTDKSWTGKKKATKHNLAVKLGDQTLNVGAPTVWEVDGRDVEHQLKVKLNGFAMTSDRFEVVRGEETVLTIAYTARPAAAQAQTSAPPEATVVDPDRIAAEWVKSISGHPLTCLVIRQNGKVRHISNEELRTKPLPSEPFVLLGVHLQNNHEATDEGLANLTDCRHLMRLNLGYTAIGDEGLAHLKDCSRNLKELHLPRHVTDAGLASFRHCRELTVLTLPCVQASTDGLANFRHCKKLNTLVFVGSPLAGASLESFAGCENLSSLQIRNTEVDPAQLAHFALCKKLEVLDLSGNPQISNKELGYFRDCIKLTLLNLAYANVDDQGLSFVLNCKHLVYLNVAETDVSESFLQELSEALPDCDIDRKPKWPAPEAE